MAASQGALLLAAGAKGKRFAMPNTRIMIHQPQGGCGVREGGEKRRERGREGGRRGEGRREGGREGGKEAGREAGREERRKAGNEENKEEGEQGDKCFHPRCSNMT